jgi:Tol biopolymer transport system component
VDLRNVDTTSSRVTQVSVPSTGQLSAVAAPAPPEEQPAGPLKRWLKAWPVALGALLAGLAAGYGLFAGSGPDAANEPLLRVEIPLPSMRYVRFPALSPTRGYLAVVGSDTLDRTGIFLRDMSSGEMRHLEGTANAGAREIKFSPDGTRLAFTADANSGVFTVVLPSGLPERQTELGRLIYWEDTETILYLDDAPGGKTYRKRLGQGESEEIPLEDPTLTEELVDIIKTGIPGSDLAFGHQFVRTAGGAYTGVSKVFSANLASGRVEILESEVMNPEYVSGGFLTYQMRGDEGLLVVRRIDENTGRFVGTPRDVLSGGESTVWGQYAVTDGGDLVYQSWDALPGTATNRLLTIDLATRTIRPVDLVMSGRRTPLGPRYSPVNDDIAFGLAEGDDSIVAVYDVALGSHLQKSFEGRRDYPFWSPDGRYLYYHTEDADGTSLVRRRADESGTEELVREDFAAHEFSPDGRFLSGVRFKSDERTELVLVDVRSGDVTSLDSSRAFFDASFSPDGRFLVYGRPTATGQSLVVRSVSGQGRYEIPNLTARGPRWSPDGKYIYFLSGGIRRLPVRTSPGFQVVGNPELVASTSGSESFDLNRDGTKIVVSARDAQFRMSYQTPSVIWLQNWSAHLQREMSL